MCVDPYMLFMFRSRTVFDQPDKKEKTLHRVKDTYLLLICSRLSYGGSYANWAERGLTSR